MSEQRNPAFFLSGERPAVQKKAGFLAHSTFFVLYTDLRIKNDPRRIAENYPQSRERECHRA